MIRLYAQQHSVSVSRLHLRPSFSWSRQLERGELAKVLQGMTGLAHLDMRATNLADTDVLTIAGLKCA